MYRLILLSCLMAGCVTLPTWDLDEGETQEAAFGVAVYGLAIELVGGEDPTVTGVTIYLAQGTTADDPCAAEAFTGPLATLRMPLVSYGSGPSAVYWADGEMASVPFEVHTQLETPIELTCPYVECMGQELPELVGTVEVPTGDGVTRDGAFAAQHCPSLDNTAHIEAEHW